MHIQPFTTEQYYALYEFNTPHLLSVSDCESMTIADLLDLANMSLTDFASLHLGYTESTGHPDLRRAIATTYESIEPDDVVVLTSPEEGIFVALHTLLDRDDEVVVLTPAYDSLLNLAEHVSGNVKKWEIVPTETGWQLDLNALEYLVTPDTKLLVVNFPHNPTGYLPTPTEFAMIREIARRNDCWLFCDEMYRGLELGDTVQLPSAVDRSAKAIVLSGMSKTHGLPGLRAGWLVVRDKATREAVINWKHYTSICPSAPSEALALAGLQVEKQLIERNKAIINHNLDVAAEFFPRHSDLFTYRPPQAGSVALVKINVPSATEYCHQLAQTQGVLLLPSSCMGYGDGHVRFGFGRKSFSSALAHYEKHLSQP